MSIRIVPYEIALLEHFTSISYFEALRDTWEEMVKHIEVCLDRYLKVLPPNHRSTPLPYQADIVWGWRVLPNFRNTLEGLQNGFILITHGQAEGYAYAHGVQGDFKGQLDYDAEWMGKADEERYQYLMDKSISIAHNIALTEGAEWSSLYFYEPHRLGLSDQLIQPGKYRINKAVTVKTGEKTSVSGIYVPDVDNSSSQFLSTRYKQAPMCSTLIGFKDVLDPTTGKKCDEELQHEDRPCTWFLVERIIDAEGKTSSSQHEELYMVRIRSGDICTRTGHYFTPARMHSRKKFHEGETMPAFDSEYGATIWQWDGDD